MPKAPELSIIIPCYNVADTLQEAVGSIFTQELAIPFEVVAVDDGSSDTTWELLTAMEARYEHFYTYQHKENQGGGAARNTGIRYAHGDLIYCLDGDNVLAPGTLGKLVSFLLEKSLDGAAIEKRKFFLGNNKLLFSLLKNEVLGRGLDLRDLLGGHILLDNFLYRKSAWERSGGYPEHHDFDTQGFEVRFIANGNSIQVCPETEIFHRQAAKERSYFERVYESGVYSLNMYLIYEEVLHLLAPQIIQKIIQYNLFQHAGLQNENFFAYLSQLHEANPESFFIKNWQQYLSTTGYKKFLSDHAYTKSVEFLFQHATFLHRHGQYQKALDLYLKIIEHGQDTPLLYFTIQRAITGLTKKYTSNELERRTLSLLKEMSIHQQTSVIRQPLLVKVLQKINRMIKNNFANR